LKQLKITLNTDEKEWIKERSRSLFGKLDNGKKPYYVTRKSLIHDLMESLGYLLTEGEGNHKSKEIKNREYYSLIHLPKELRTLIPLKYLIIDLDSSNPQIVDSMIGSNIGLSVYDNIMNALECSRDDAKTEYNKTLNRHYLKLKDAMEFYIICGYTEDESLQLARLTTGVKKGEFYERTTQNEKLLMENYSDYLIPKSHRFHDAVIVKMESVEGTHIGLPLVVKGHKYHINIFNDGGDYEGLVL